MGRGNGVRMRQDVCDHDDGHGNDAVQIRDQTDIWGPVFRSPQTMDPILSTSMSHFMSGQEELLLLAQFTFFFFRNSIFERGGNFSPTIFNSDIELSVFQFRMLYLFVYLSLCRRQHLSSRY